MKRSNKKIVEDEFSKYVRSKKLLEDISGTDSWDEPEEDEDELEVDDDLESIDIEIEDEEFPEDEIIRAIKNELEVPEFNRRYVVFTDMKTDEEVKGIPMAQIGGDAFLFKVDDKLKKYKIENMKFDY